MEKIAGEKAQKKDKEEKSGKKPYTKPSYEKKSTLYRDTAQIIIYYYYTW